MNTENEFNAYLTKEIRKLGTSYKAIKMSDRFKIGVPDWIMFHAGKSVAVEAKFARKLPQRGKVLNHPVTGPQISYLKSLALAGVPGKVLIAASFDNLIRIVPLESLPEDGNFTTEEFNFITETSAFKISEMDIFMRKIFEENT